MMQHLHIGGPRGFGAGVTWGVREVSAQQLVALHKSLWTWESCPVICEMMVTLSRPIWQVAVGSRGTTRDGTCVGAGSWTEHGVRGSPARAESERPRRQGEEGRGGGGYLGSETAQSRV